MARVALIPTGQMEWQALGTALHRLFPGHHFYAVPTEAERASNPRLEFPISSFTSCDVARVMGRKNNADKLIERAAYEIMRGAEGADLAIILDDLELDNIQQASRVTDGIREAVERHLEGLAAGGTEKHRDLCARTREALKEKASFHLARPMIESWLFSDPSGPANAGIPPDRAVRLKAGLDPEAFETDDPDFAVATGEGCTKWLSMPERSRYHRQKKERKTPIWVKQGPQRIYHPKVYMSWLARDPKQRTCTRYQETKGGSDALERLDWHEVLRPTATWMPFLTSLVNDLADGLGQRPAVGALLGAEATETGRAHLPSSPRLRNL